MSLWLLQQSCPNADGGAFGYPGGACPVAGVNATTSDTVQYEAVYDPVTGLPTGAFTSTDLGDLGDENLSSDPTVLPGTPGYLTVTTTQTPTCTNLFAGMVYKLTVFIENFTYNTDSVLVGLGESVFTTVTFTATGASQTLAPIALGLNSGYQFYISRLVVEWLP